MCFSVMICMHSAMLSCGPTHTTGEVMITATGVSCEERPCRITLRA